MSDIAIKHLEERLRRHEKDDAAVHERVRIMGETMSSLTGMHGKNGRIGDLEQSSDDHEVRVRGLEAWKMRAIGLIAGLTMIASLFGSALGVYIISSIITGTP